MATLRDFSSPEHAEISDKPDRPGERIEVELDETNQLDLKLKLRQQSWAEGMGWFTQKTVAINPEDVPELLRQLEQAQVNVKLTRSQAHHRPSTPEPEAPAETKIIKFPVHRTVRKAEPAETEQVASEQGKVLLFKSRRHSGS
jgi:hypothetical protein